MGHLGVLPLFSIWDSHLNPSRSWECVIGGRWEGGKKGEVNRKEVGKRKNFGVEKRLKKSKTLGKGGCAFGSSPKQLE
jgi:hypothetical protein